MSFEQMNLFGETLPSHKREKNKTIVSASRRTDIPAFYYEWLQNALKKGSVELRNPMFPAKIIQVDLKPENVHSVVLWSKDFSNVARDPGYLSNYNLYFQYTINNYNRLLEPGVPDYCNSLKTLEGLLKRYRPEQFNIRFDPVIVSRRGEWTPTAEFPQKARLDTFEKLCRDIGNLGLNHCRVTTSYISFYHHVRKKIGESGAELVYLNESEQRSFFEDMAGIADRYGIRLYACASPLLGTIDGISEGCCIDGKLLISLFGGSVSMQKDKGQRIECKCTASKDIGSYSDGADSMKCLHGCRYCYVR